MQLRAADFAYQTIKSKILSLEYEPGLRLKEVQLAQKLELTRTPIREAFIKLERERLLTIYPNKGAFVVRLSKTEIEELFEVREALEAKAGHLTIRRANRDELALVKAALDREKANARNTLDHLQWPATDFHYEIIKLTKNQRLISIWESLDAQLSLMRHRSAVLDKRYFTALEEHDRILAYIAGGNYKKTEKLIIAHIRKARNNLLSQLDDKSQEANGLP